MKQTEQSAAADGECHNEHMDNLKTKGQLQIIREAYDGSVDCHNEGFFAIASAIGVLEYYEIAYIAEALQELNRVLNEEGRLVIDMPNERRPDMNTMIEYEAYLGRTRGNIPSAKEFAGELGRFFEIAEVKDTQIMSQYFVRKR